MADHDVEMANCHYSSSPELSSLPSDSPSEPGSPSRLDQRRSSLGHKNDEIVVDASSIPRYPLMQQQQQQQSQQSSQLHPNPLVSATGVRLTKDGTPRKKPGRKPGTTVKKPTDSAASSPAGTVTASGTEAKPRRVRKVKDPNAPPVQRKKRVSAAAAAAAAAATPAPEPEAPRSISAMPLPQKVELASMRMDIDSRPMTSTAIPAPSTRQPPRQPPLTVVGKYVTRETGANSVQSILNSDDSPPPAPAPTAPTSTTPSRSSVLGYDPVRASTSSYDPVRESFSERSSYGARSLGSPRGLTQMPNRASASPSIASLVDPAPPLAHSPVAASTINHRVSPPPYPITTSLSSHYRDSNPSLPPSPSPAPAIHNMVSSSTSSSAQPQSTVPKTKAATMSTSMTTVTTSSAAAPVAKSASASTKSAAAKSEVNGHKSHSRPPPPPPIPATVKSTASKSATTKSTIQKSSDSKAPAATLTAAEKQSSSKPSGPVTTSFRDVAMTGTGTNTSNATASASSAPLIKKFSSILQQERGGKQNRAATSVTSSPKLSGVNKDDAALQLTVPDSVSLPGSETERSILDFGKARPGEETQAPSIVLHIPLVRGENNKYVNFMRMAEDRYGWDALHPRLAAHRDRKLRIAAASAALERNGSGRESGEEMTDDMQSGDEGSNDENGGGTADTSMIPASLPGELIKPARKKRMFKEDEYDKDDDFVDDSELLWEEQAAASRDGFFVYSGPLVPEEEKPDEGSAPPSKRARGGRTTRGGTTKTTSRSTAARSTASGSRGTTTARKPRITKQEKEQREREKADSDKTAQSTKSASNLLTGPSSNLSTSMVVDA